MDPQCGWCYGNSNNIFEIQKEFSSYFEFEILAGGMWLNENAPIGGENLSQFLKTNTPNMTSRTGAIISPEFFELAKDNTYKFSSLEPSAAIVLLKELFPYKAFLFAREIQSVMFIDGKRLDKKETYLAILDKLNIYPTFFNKSWLTEDNLVKTHLDFAKASELANGFPTLVLEENGSKQVLNSGYFEKQSISELLTSLK